MPIYRIDGFTIGGDHAYVEADDFQTARERLTETLKSGDAHVDVTAILPPPTWTVREVVRPLVAIVWRD